MNLPSLEDLKAHSNGIREAVETNTAAIRQLVEQLAVSHQINDLNQADFCTKTLGWSIVVPPYGGSIFVTGVWFTFAGTGNIGFGQGGSGTGANPSPDATRFQAFLESGGTAGQFPLATDGGFSMSKDPWVYKTDPGKGFAIYNGVDGTLVAGHLTYWVGDPVVEVAVDTTV